MIKILLLFIMLFLHLVDDYYLQGILASMKQKSWWEKNAPDDLYKHDYIIALIEHAYSWTFMIMLAPTIYWIYTDKFDLTHTIIFIFYFIFNWYIHAYADHLKANKHVLNLIQDQVAHIIQIVGTYLVFILI